MGRGDDELAPAQGDCRFILVFYATVILAVIVACYRSVRATDLTLELELPRIPLKLDPYEVAYLRGGENAMTRCPDQIEPPWAVELARYELAWTRAARADRSLVVRTFKFPVARLAIGRETEPVMPRATLALWWRPTRRGRVRHMVISMPILRQPRP